MILASFWRQTESFGDLVRPPVSGGCRRLWFLVLAAAARIHGGSCWWQAQSSSQSCLYFSYVIGTFVQSWWTPVLLYPSRARLCVHVYLCCLFSY